MTHVVLHHEHCGLLDARVGRAYHESTAVDVSRGRRIEILPGSNGNNYVALGNVAMNLIALGYHQGTDTLGCHAPGQLTPVASWPTRIKVSETNIRTSSDPRPISSRLSPIPGSLIARQPIFLKRPSSECRGAPHTPSCQERGWSLSVADFASGVRTASTKLAG